MESKFKRKINLLKLIFIPVCSFLLRTRMSTRRSTRKRTRIQDDEDDSEMVEQESKPKEQRVKAPSPHPGVVLPVMKSPVAPRRPARSPVVQRPVAKSPVVPRPTVTHRVVQSPVVVEDEHSDEDDAEVSDAEEDDEKEYDPEAEERDPKYFEDDTSPMKTLIVEELLKNFKLDAKDVEPVVDQALRKLPLLTDEYSKSHPADLIWKIGVDPNVVRRLEPTLISLRDEIQVEQPTILRILGAHISRDDKKKALEYFDVLENVEPYTEDFLRLKTVINDILKKAYKTHDEMLKLQADEKVLQGTAPVLGYLERIVALEASAEIKARIYEKYQAFKELSADGRDYESQKTWLDHALALPYDKIHDTELPTTPEGINALCVKIKAKLDEKVYGLEKVKQQLLGYVVSRITNPAGGSRINLALSGPPGVGKSLILGCIAEAMGLPFECISLGGLQDSSVLKGHSSTYIGSEPGIIVQILKRIKTKRGFILFDEIEKLASSERGREVQYSLLHITDFTANKDYRDNYLSDLPIDLSGMFFVFAMNNDDWLDKALRDRLSISHIKSYTHKEKEKIVRSYILPSALKDVGLEPESVLFNDDALSAFVRSGPQDENIRPLKDEIVAIVTKINLYRSVLLADGTTGEVKLDFKIPKFKIPLTLTPELINTLSARNDKEEDLSKLMMYN
jgi:hypothetical protein